jgi:hypothetical protein
MPEIVNGLDAKDIFTKKIGGLPGIAWVGIVVGGAYGYRWYKNRGHVGSVTSTAPATTDNAGTIVDPNSVVGLPAPTNNSWATSAADHLMAAGAYNPGDVQTALANYISGNGLNSTQQTIINSVLHNFGTPPEGVMAITQIPTDTNLGGQTSPSIPTPITSTITPTVVTSTPTVVVTPITVAPPQPSVVTPPTVVVPTSTYVARPIPHGALDSSRL